MTDNEIIKALECCSEHEACRNCPCKNKCGDLSVVTAEALNYINQLESKVENYKHLDVILNTAVDTLTQKIKSEVIKEFAEKLVAEYKTTYYLPNDDDLIMVAKSDMYNLVKEMVGEN